MKNRTIIFIIASITLAIAIYFLFFRNYAPVQFEVKGFLGPDTSNFGYFKTSGKYYVVNSTIAGEIEREITKSQYERAYIDAKLNGTLL